MRKNVLFVFALFAIMGATTAYPDSITLTTTNGAVGYIARHDSTGYILAFPNYRLLNSYHSANPQTSRSFVEFSLQQWYALGLSESALMNVTFTASFYQASSWPDSYKAPIKFYEMTARDNDGTYSTYDDFIAPVSAIGSTIEYSVYSNGLSIDVTDAFLEDAGAQNYTGYSVRLADERIGDTTVLRGVIFESPTLTITYNANAEPPQTIPEPVTILMFLIGGAPLLRKKVF